MTSRNYALVLLIAVGLLGAVSLGWHLRPQPAAPTDEQWRAAGVWLESRLTDGDVLRVRPAWMVQAETLLRSVSADKHPFIDRSKTASRMLGAQYKRLWQLSAMGYSAGPPPTGATEISRFDLDGGIEVILYRLDRDRIRFPLAAHLRDAVVSRRRGPDDAYTACRRRNDWHDCRGKAWENVRTQLHHVGGAPRQCFTLHPYPDHGSVRISWPSLQFGSALLLRSGFTLEAARNEKGADCDVRVSINGAVVAEWSEPKNGWHFEERQLDTTKWEGATGELVIEVSSPDEDFRDLCFDGAVLITTD